MDLVVQQVSLVDQVQETWLVLMVMVSFDECHWAWACWFVALLQEYAEEMAELSVGRYPWVPQQICYEDAVRCDCVTTLLLWGCTRWCRNAVQDPCLSQLLGSRCAWLHLCRRLADAAVEVKIPYCGRYTSLKTLFVWPSAFLFTHLKHFSWHGLAGFSILACSTS